MKRSLLMVTALAAATICSTASADARQELVNAFERAMAQGRFIATVETEGKRASTVEMRVQLPDRFHMRTADTEMIILPQATWMNADGQWMKFPMNMSKAIEGYSQRGIEEGMAALRDVREVGRANVQGCDSTLYAYRTEGKFMGVESRSDVEAAICGETGFPVRLVSQDRKGRPEAAILYDFSTDFEIRPPN
jgi:hypothetical protein